MIYAFLADAIVIAHFAYMAFIVVGLLLILAGIALKWPWVRNPWFRLGHLAAIVVVALEAVGGIVCPLTQWEYDLRVKAGHGAREGSFVGRLAHDLLFYDFPPWVFTTAYVAFALAVLATFVLAPPRRKPLMHHHLGHEDERWGFWSCQILGEPIILGTYDGTGSKPQGSMTCYRAGLCEKECRDCFIARPAETKHIPFEWNDALAHLRDHGMSSGGGVEYIRLLRETDVPGETKVRILHELRDYLCDLQDGVDPKPEDVRQLLADLHT